MDLLKKAILVLVWPVNIDGRPWRREPEAELLDSAKYMVM